MARSIQAGRLSYVLCALGSAACLAPSFDGLQSKRADDSAAAKGDGGRDGGAPADGGSSTEDGGNTSTAKPPKTGAGGGTIACGSKSCAMPEMCCTTVGGASCQSNSVSGFCTTVEGGEIFRCDDNDDCGSAESCCYVAAQKTASCGIGCGNGGKMLCDPARPACPAGETCSGTLNGGHHYCQ